MYFDYLLYLIHTSISFFTSIPISSLLKKAVGTNGSVFYCSMRLSQTLPIHDLSPHLAVWSYPLVYAIVLFLYRADNFTKT